MRSLTARQFDNLVLTAVNNLPEPFRSKINNVAFVVEDTPSAEQRQKLQLTKHQSLYGLYEGIPLTERTNYTHVLPDKITIFKKVIEFASQNNEDVEKLVRQTVWHEVAHHFGLGHGRIEALQQKQSRRNQV